MALEALLWCVAALLATGVAGLTLHRYRAANALVYGGCLVAASVGLAAAAGSLLSPASPGPALILPLGLPWLGAHFRIDALSAFFLTVVNLGGAAASLFARGY